MMTKQEFEACLEKHADEIERIRQSAHELHRSVNQTYGDGLPYSYHLDMVVSNVREFGHLVCASEEDVLPLIFGGYYHDVGKLSAPGKFTENLALGETNPHDALPPHMSALVLSAHVKDGIALALDYRLPVPIRDIIEEHHGSSLMAFFLDKARKQAEAKAAASGAEPEPVDENLFRYTGRRPTSAEAAIVSLADSVEAASRSLPSVTPAQLEKLVDMVRLVVSDPQAFVEDVSDEAPTILSAREIQVLKAFAAGKTREEVAAELGVGTETVKTHTRLIMKKLDVPNTLSAVTTALRLGLIR